MSPNRKSLHSLGVVCLLAAPLLHPWAVTAQHIPIQIIERAGNARATAHVTGGVPLGRGTAQPHTAWTLTDAAGSALPLQTRVMATWPDGSAKWLLLDTQTDLHPNESRTLTLAPGDPAPISQLVTVKQTLGGVTVNTGLLQFRVNTERFTFLENVTLNGVPLTRNGNGIHLRDVHGTDYWSGNDDRTYSLHVEHDGPLHAVIKAQGTLRAESGEDMYTFVVRLHAYAGKTFVRAEIVILINGDPESEFAKFIEIESPLDFAGPAARTVAVAGEAAANDAGELMTVDVHPDRDIDTMPEGNSIKSLVQYANDKWLANGFRGRYWSGRRTAGWMDVRHENKGLLVVIPDMWKLHPKEINVDPARDLLRVGLYPRHAPEIGILNLARGYEGRINYDNAPGTAYGAGLRTDVVYHFHSGTLERAATANNHHRPPVIQATPQHIADTRALGLAVSPARPEAFPAHEAYVRKLHEWVTTAREHFGWYGQMNLGDVVSTLNWPQGTDNGWGANAWLNGEFDLPQGLWTQYTRTGNPALRDRAIEASRHHIFIDHIKPVDLTKPDTWTRHPDTGMGRRHADRHLTGEAGPTHTNTESMLTYSYITGDPWGLEMARYAGDAMLPRDFYGSLRQIANTLGALTFASRIDWQKKYRHRIDQWIQMFQEGQTPEGNWERTHARDKGWVRTVNTYGYNTAGCYMNYLANVLEALYEDTGDERIRAMYLRAADWWIANADWDNAITTAHWPIHRHGDTPGRWAYAYILSGDRKYLDAAKRFCDLLMTPRTGGNMRFGLGPWRVDLPPHMDFRALTSPLITLSNPTVIQLHSIPAVIAALEKERNTR